MEFRIGGLRSGLYERSQNLKQQMRDELSDISRWYVEYGELTNEDAPDERTLKRLSSPRRYFVFRWTPSDAVLSYIKSINDKLDSIHPKSENGWKFLMLKARPVAAEHQKINHGVVAYKPTFSLEGNSLVARTYVWGKALRYYNKLKSLADQDIIISQRFKIVLSIPLHQRLPGFPWFDEPSEQ